jgi:hypothetical protein
MKSYLKNKSLDNKNNTEEKDENIFDNQLQLSLINYLANTDIFHNIINRNKIKELDYKNQFKKEKMNIIIKENMNKKEDEFATDNRIQKTNF